MHALRKDRVVAQLRERRRAGRGRRGGRRANRRGHLQGRAIVAEAADQRAHGPEPVQHARARDRTSSTVGGAGVKAGIAPVRGSI